MEAIITPMSTSSMLCFFLCVMFHLFSFQVFEYFESFKTPDGEVLVTPAELMRAVVPVFPPSESNRIREGFLRGETVPGELHCAPSRFFMLFDTNSDGLISFSE